MVQLYTRSVRIKFKHSNYIKSETFNKHKPRRWGWIGVGCCTPTVSLVVTPNMRSKVLDIFQEVCRLLKMKHQYNIKNIYTVMTTYSQYESQ